MKWSEAEFARILKQYQTFTWSARLLQVKKPLSMVSELIPDIVLLDLIMPGMDGIETTRRSRQISPRSQVVVLTSYHEDVHIFPALKAGAISYIFKDMKMEKLVEVLHRAVQGEVTCIRGWLHVSCKTSAVKMGGTAAYSLN
jgi:DNA-binding NarL/FixJ family response regulator